ncbi:hypothetical protein LJC32_02085 [Oscillospiraceae bacterium OttesenSCG-928-F05]|nr:hypothetical protein [Oscillospiraceae bacterium OttesenSCG-928-F05]
MKKRKLATKFMALLIVMVTLFSLSSALAVNVQIEAQEAVAEPAAICAEEFAYYYRTHNNQLQQRIWSLTYGYWVTPWTNVY